MTQMRKLVNISSKPGVKRDGTDLESEFYNDAQHCRFQRGRPRKIGGYRQMAAGFNLISRGLYISNQSGTVNVHSGCSNMLQACQFNPIGVGGGIVDRTPSGFTPSVRTTTLLVALAPISVVAGSTTVVITDPGHGSSVGGFITLSGFTNVNAAFSAVPSSFWNQTFRISAVTANTITIDLGSPSAATATGPSFSGGPDPVMDVLANDLDNVWVMDTMYDPTGSSTDLLFAMATPSLAAIDDETNVQLYYGDANTLSSPLTAMPVPGSGTKGPAQVSGGVLSTPPYLWVYGNNGYVQWSVPGSPTNFYDSGTGFANVTNQKIVCGAATRGGPSQSPSGLFWSLDSLIRFGFVGSTTVFRFDTISNQISILSNKCVVEYDGVYYWPGTDRFYGYNGVVTPLPNNLNRNYFYENLNLAQRQKVWGMKVPAFNEIWWFYPFGDATECTNAIIYNVAENTWYDTVLPRCAGFYNPIFGFPVMFGTSSEYRLWQHEYGVDEIINNNIQAIPSWFETANMAFIDQGPMRDGWVGGDKWIRCIRVEPDFVQTGALTLEVIGRTYAQSPSWSDSFPMPEGTEKVDTGKGTSQSGQHRIMSLKFTSNVIGGDYQLGESLALVDIGDGRQ